MFSTLCLSISRCFSQLSTIPGDAGKRRCVACASWALSFAHVGAKIWQRCRFFGETHGKRWWKKRDGDKGIKVHQVIEKFKSLQEHLKTIKLYWKAESVNCLILYWTLLRHLLKLLQVMTCPRLPYSTFSPAGSFRPGGPVQLGVRTAGLVSDSCMYAYCAIFTYIIYM